MGDRHLNFYEARDNLEVNPWAVPADGLGDVEAVGEIVHMPVRRSLRIGAPPEEMA